MKIARKKESGLTVQNAFDAAKREYEQKKESYWTLKKIEMDTDYHIGDHVMLTQGREGHIRFIGCVYFTKGRLYGIELKPPSSGKHDGSKDGHQYFKVESIHHYASSNFIDFKFYSFIFRLLHNAVFL